MKAQNLYMEFEAPLMDDEKLAWLKRRQLGIGGSDASVCIGVNKYKNKYELYMDKITEPIDVCNEPMHWGNRLESIIVDEFLKRFGIEDQYCRTSLEMVSKQHDWMRANLDAKVLDHPVEGSFVIEAKNVSEYVKGDWGNDYIPDHIYAQCQHNMMVAEMELCYCVALLGGNTFQIHRIVKDDEYCETLFLAEENFWNEYVLKNIAPPVGPKDGDVLIRQFPESDGEQSEPDPKIDLYVDQINSYNEQIKDINALKETSVNACKLIIGDNESAEGLLHSAKWKTAKAPVRLNKSLLERDHPGIMKKYLAEGKPQRRFTTG